MRSSRSACWRARATRSRRPATATSTVLEVPGAFELPLGGVLCGPVSGRFAGVACLGAVIRGETDHYDFVCAEAARGIMRVQLDTGVPCAFGVLTCQTLEQALERSGRRKARPGRQRRAGRARDGRAASRAVRAARLGAADHLDCRCTMAKVCHCCGKGPAFGQSRSHSMVATKRRFDPNLQKVRILVGKAPRRVYVCTRCLKAEKVTKAL